METMVDEPFGDVIDGDPVLGEDTCVHDALVCHTATLPLVQDRVGLGKPARQVVGAQNRHPGCLRQALSAHETQVGPRDWQDRGGPERCSRHRALLTAGRVAWQVRSQVLLHTDGSHAGAATAMRDGEGLVQVHVADVASQVAGTYQAHQGIHVGAVDVHLPAVGVRDVADLPDGVLENTMCGRIGDHDGCQLVTGPLRLRCEVIQVDVPVIRGLHRDHLHARHGRRSRVRAMGGGGDQADAAVIIVGPVICGDCLQPGIFALGAAVGLHRECVISRDLAEQCLQIRRQLLVALRLGGGGEWVQACELRPGDGHHLDRGIQLHGAGTQGNHRPVQRQVPVREAAHVAHHLRLGPVHVEHRMGQVLRRTQQRVWNGRVLAELLGGFDAESIQYPGESLQGGGLID